VFILGVETSNPLGVAAAALTPRPGIQQFFASNVLDHYAFLQG
jgi:hypothetical protein